MSAQMASDCTILGHCNVTLILRLPIEDDARGVANKFSNRRWLPCHTHYTGWNRKYSVVLKPSTAHQSTQEKYALLRLDFILSVSVLWLISHTCSFGIVNSRTVLLLGVVTDFLTCSILCETLFLKGDCSAKSKSQSVQCSLGKGGTRSFFHSLVYKRELTSLPSILPNTMCFSIKILRNLSCLGMLLRIRYQFAWINRNYSVSWKWKDSCMNPHFTWIIIIILVQKISEDVCFVYVSDILRGFTGFIKNGQFCMLRKIESGGIWVIKRNFVSETDVIPVKYPEFFHTFRRVWYVTFKIDLKLCF